MDDILANIVDCTSDAEKAQAYAENIGVTALDDVKALLSALYLNEDPNTATLEALGPDGLNVLLRPRDDNFKHTTLLTEATRKRNYRWVTALLSAGADPNGSGSLMAYTASDAIFHPSSQWYHAFQDGSPAVPFLKAYLEHGGDLNTTAGGGYNANALINAPFKNLAAQIFLLEQGADPWLISKEAKPRNFDLTMMGGNIWGSRSAQNNEEMYILVQRGLYTPPYQEAYKPMVHDTYIDTLEQLHDATGPERRHELWTLKKVINALIDAGHIVPSPKLRELLEINPVSDTEGGWVLGKGQLHQAFDDSRKGPPLGSEVW
jgi:hypothetical protein